jgi:hypothetical protein
MLFVAMLFGMFAVMYVAYAEEAHADKDTWLDALMRAGKCRGITTKDRAGI